MPVKYHIRLAAEEQHSLKALVKSKAARHKRLHAQILLGLNENGPALSEIEVADVCATSKKTVQRTRKRAVEEGLGIAIEGKFSRKGAERKLNGEKQAYLIALTCSEPPEGRSKWTMELLADKLVELDIVESVSDTTV
ncbi:helix-turn-helix domain-containing protein [Sansalvadorimonas sp. 2012CJ34-2]|uniref:Helix-turn-helix domain-containing protein n=1 Tax=Parendozoicomonas callyspongiae TaxID=2942213 RepID=A0ABT0PL78_9GAMM|nr:helix-turn-helix domain-containing protein [Sansalvadorimonas sp. 2012CJ34-2]MCL6272139.1 helix-turn-helix domain-containing protein [Sansalvadorimonas sp. 2012CJ34-2]